MHEDAGQRERTILIPTTPQQDAQVQNFVDNAVQAHQTYDLNDRNCVDFVREALAAAGIRVQDLVRPEAQMQNVEREAHRMREEQERKRLEQERKRQEAEQEKRSLQ